MEPLKGKIEGSLGTFAIPYGKKEDDGLGRVTQKYQRKEDTEENGVLKENKCSDGF